MLCCISVLEYNYKEYSSKGWREIKGIKNFALQKFNKPVFNKLFAKECIIFRYQLIKNALKQLMVSKYL